MEFIVGSHCYSAYSIYYSIVSWLSLLLLVQLPFFVVFLLTAFMICSITWRFYSFALWWCGSLSLKSCLNSLGFLDLWFSLKNYLRYCFFPILNVIFFCNFIRCKLGFHFFSKSISFSFIFPFLLFQKEI